MTDVYLQKELGEDRKISGQARFLKQYRLYSAALYYKNLNDTPDRRAARVTRWALETLPMPDLAPGQNLFAGVGYSIDQRIPGDDEKDFGFRFVASGEPRLERDKMKKLEALCKTVVESRMVELFLQNAEAATTLASPNRYLHGGLHFIPDFSFVLEHGFVGFQKRIVALLAEERDVRKRNFLEGMAETAEGVLVYLRRAADYVASLAETEPAFERMASALKRLTYAQPESFYEAYLAMDLTMLFTNYEPGRIDYLLYPFYERDLKKGVTSKEEAISLFTELFRNMDTYIGHPGAVHATIGGTDEEGKAVYNDLTLAAIIAVRGLRMPNLSLRVREDMPQFLWDAVLYNLGKGYSHPALVNESIYLNGLTKDFEIPYHDAVNYVFGGCSEVMIQGKSTCNSTWVAYNMLDVFEHTLYSHLLSCNSYEKFYNQYKQDLVSTLEELAGNICLREFSLAENQSNTLRSLFTDGCLTHGKGFFQGGSQYNFDSTNIYGGTNAINSMYTVKQLYDGRLGLTKEELLDGLIHDFQGYGKVFTACKGVEKFGNDNEELEEIARDLMGTAFEEVMKHHTWRGNEDYQGRFMPAVILWVDWITCGEKVGATPDGRVAGEATVDSAGPMQGTDTQGPTSSMTATLSLPQEKCAGTCVMNLRLDPVNFKTEAGRQKVQALIETYLEQGGCQLQVNVVDGELLKDALLHPDQHKDIIVRVGGFSDHFVMLSGAIQEQIIKRTEHTI